MTCLCFNVGYERNQSLGREPIQLCVAVGVFSGSESVHLFLRGLMKPDTNIMIQNGDLESQLAFVVPHSRNDLQHNNPKSNCINSMVMLLATYCIIQRCV